MRNIPKTAVDFIAAHEGVKLSAYLDSANVPTIGYGHINGVKMGDVCTKAQALDWLSSDLQTTRRKLYGVVKSDIIDLLTENQWSALLSFVFNLGAGPAWKIWKLLNAKQFDQVPGELIKFVNAGGQKVQGLVNRRADEVKLWSTDEPGSTTQVISSGVTRATATPPTVTDPVPPQKSATIYTAGISAAGGVAVAAKQISDTIAPYQAASPWIGQAVAVIATLAAGAAVAVLVLNWLRKRSERAQ